MKDGVFNLVVTLTCVSSCLSRLSICALIVRLGFTSFLVSSSMSYRNRLVQHRHFYERVCRVMVVHSQDRIEILKPGSNHILKLMSHIALLAAKASKPRFATTGVRRINNYTYKSNI